MDFFPPCKASLRLPRLRFNTIKQVDLRLSTGIAIEHDPVWFIEVRGHVPVASQLWSSQSLAFWASIGCGIAYLWQPATWNMTNIAG